MKFKKRIAISLLISMTASFITPVEAYSNTEYELNTSINSKVEREGSDFKELESQLLQYTTPSQISTTSSQLKLDTTYIVDQNQGTTITEVYPNGFLGYFYEDNNFTELSFIQSNISSRLFLNQDLDTYENNFKSAKLIGCIKPSQEGEYYFHTNGYPLKINVDGKDVFLEDTIRQSIYLEKDNIYGIEIQVDNVVDNLEDIQLLWSSENISEEVIPYENIILPDMSMSVENKFNISTYFNDITKNNDTDSDGDTIPDEWEINGYTMKNRTITKWDESFIGLYDKYVSNPYKKRTSNDPYTDLEKVLGQMPASTRLEARDPLVAAYPAVSVSMEKLLISRSENVSEGASGTIGKVTNESTTNIEKVNVGAGITIGKKTASLNVGANYEYSSNKTVGHSYKEDESWSKQIGGNTADAAYLNANIRYYNHGTSPIYNTQPTTNFLLGPDKTLATIKASGAQMAAALTPSDTFPSKGLSPIALDRVNEGGRIRISVNREQLEDIEKKRDKVMLETIQTNGLYGRINPTNEQLEIKPENEWAYIKSEIEVSSATLTLQLPDNSVFERKIATKDPLDKNDYTPTITIREAIMKAFNTGYKHRDEELYFTDNNGNRHLLDEKSVILAMDDATKQKVDNQLPNYDNEVYNVPLEKGMNITVLPTQYYDTMDRTKPWENIDYVHDPKMGTVGWISSVSSSQLPKDLFKKDETYLLTMKIKAYDKSVEVPFTVYLGEGTATPEVIDLNIGVRMDVKISTDKWSTLTLPFNTGSNPNDILKKIVLVSEGGVVLVDDITILQINQNQSFLQEEYKVKDWHQESPALIDKVIFENNMNTEGVKYGMQIDGVDSDKRIDMKKDASGNKYIDLKELNNGINIYAGSKINIIASKAENPHIRGVVASYRVQQDEAMLKNLYPRFMEYIPGLPQLDFGPAKQYPSSVQYRLIRIAEGDGYTTRDIYPHFVYVSIQRIPIYADHEYALAIRTNYGEVFYSPKFLGNKIPGVR